jgi:hypothetical protein
MIRLSEHLYKDIFKLQNEDTSRLLRLDRRYNKLVLKRRELFNEKDVANVKEEMEKFFEARKAGKKYYPVLDVEECKYDDELINELTSLMSDFRAFPGCYLSKYYIESLNREIEWCKFYINKRSEPKLAWKGKTLSKEELERAIHNVKTIKYEKPKHLNRNITAERAKVLIQKALDELGYKWKPIICSGMLARMNVLPNGYIRIGKDATFNEVDIEGLIEHEIKGHIGRRYNGMLKGLYIMVHGFRGRNILDEGLAVYNSLHNVKKPKPNIMFNISLKYIISYYKNNYGFCEVFDIVKDIVKDTGISDEVLFKNIIRAKRENIDTSLLGGISDDADYFLGYNLVKDMTDEERDDILKYNIGLQHIKELDKIKAFFEVNKFNPIKYE